MVFRFGAYGGKLFPIVLGYLVELIHFFNNFTSEFFLISWLLNQSI